jgi:hypothetical protein
MVTYAHKQIIGALTEIDQAPDSPADYKAWIRAPLHLNYLQDNAKKNELIVYAFGPCSFIHSVAVPTEALSPEGAEGLLAWNDGPFHSIASYVSGGGREAMWIERGKNHCDVAALDAGVDLIFVRSFEGWTGPDRTYFEINQEYTHLNGIHWRPEQSAYCRFDDNGDLTDLVSISPHKNRDDVALVSFAWSTLEEYLSIAGYVLVRMFDFTLLRRNQFGGWGNGPENVVSVSDDLSYRQKVQGDAAYTRGVQIVRPRDAREISKQVSNRWGGRNRDPSEYVTFIAEDWRNKGIAEISTNPMATTNYFQAKHNDLPFELSPAFFRPEVLSKYKTDRDKYTVDEREIHCRAAWTLKAYDVNDAGQVFAYICYLRNLPYKEQLHWKSYNEEPKTSISKRALINDFKGEFVTFQSPRSGVLSILQRWQVRGVAWWTLRAEDLLHRANPPITASKDEWAEAVMDLSKLVVEGFEVKPLRAALTSVGETFDVVKDQSVALLEKLVAAKGGDPGVLVGLRRVQHIRSKVKGHAGSSEGKTLAQEALSEHGTYGEHFKHICELIVQDLERIESVLKP